MLLNQKKWKLFRDILLLAWFITEVFTFAYLVARSNSWILGEWLIDYSGGFTRRGLSGELIGAISFENWDLVRSVTVLVYVTLLAALVFVLRKDFLEFPTFSGLGLLLGPLALMSVFSDPLYGGRKDIMLLLLAAFSIRRQMSEKQISVRTLIIFFTLWLAVGFAHEGLLFFSPGIAVALLWMKDFHGQSTGRVIFSILPLIAAAVTAVLILLSTPAALDQTCKRWIDSGSPTGFCQGAISWSGYGLSEGFALVTNAVNSEPYFLVYGSALAVIVCVLALIIRFDAIKISWALTASFILHLGSAIMLAAISVDWGRWLHIGTVLTFMTLASAERASTPPLRPSLTVAKKVGLVHTLGFTVLFLFTGVSHFGANFTNPVMTIVQFVSNRI